MKNCNKFSEGIGEWQFMFRELKKKTQGQHSK